MRIPPTDYCIARARQTTKPYFESKTNMKTMAKLTAVTLVLASSFALAQQAGDANNTGAAATQAKKYKTPKLTRSQLDALLADPQQVLVIDVRRPDELSSIGGFPVYLSIQSKDLEKNLPFIPKDRSIVTVSNHAVRAFAAGDLLSGNGFKVAGAVGVQDYEAEGGVLSKIAPIAPKPANAAAGVAVPAKS
jgi:rhodanese-related sulfurtransferase